MPIYLPIAGLSVDIFMLIAIGAVTGVLAGMFGIGGGFLMTPFLMFIGVPPAVAVSSSANQIIASSFSGVLAHSKRANVDFQMGIYLTAGGVLGALGGIEIFKWLKQLGQIDLVISLTYVGLMGIIGLIMAYESIRTIMYNYMGKIIPSKKRASYISTLGLPFKVEFKKSNIQVSAIIPLLIGAFVGILVSIMGIGGGFFTIPAMIYLLGMPTSLVIGTSLFQITCVTSVVTFLYAINTQTVDIVLSSIMVFTSVIGAQYGARIGTKLPAEYLRMFLALMILAIVVRLGYGLVATPAHIYQIAAIQRW
ncbi:MAG: sulfite exporter TauE/SafE family protein [Alphaproteobacteria bacterium]|nr:sulfite exporter TauE/SafE family protein [Alphaproteobacteria bacterium]